MKNISFCSLKGFRLAQSQDTYPWTNCNAFESTKKNCPRGEACLKLKGYESYAWNWAMRCKFYLVSYILYSYVIFLLKFPFQM